MRHHEYPQQTLRMRAMSEIFSVTRVLCEVAALPSRQPIGPKSTWLFVSSSSPRVEPNLQLHPPAAGPPRVGSEPNSPMP